MLRRLLAFLTLLSAVLATTPAKATDLTCNGGTCPPGVYVDKEDLAVFLQLVRDQKCRNETPPEITMDPIVIVEDKDGRVYGSGADPKPFTLRMKWCNYEITGTGKVQLLVAKREPPVWGFRFRPKFSSGFLFTNAFAEKDALSAIDVGVLWEGFYYRSLNLNVATGFRSVGAGIGVDITKNFGAYAGYALSYEGLRSNPYLGLSFAFW